jgi:hypothetical protein
MRRLNPTTAFIIAGVLALLLILYVLAGGKNRSGNPEKLSEDEISGIGTPGPEAVRLSANL